MRRREIRWPARRPAIPRPLDTSDPAVVAVTALHDLYWSVLTLSTPLYTHDGPTERALGIELAAEEILRQIDALDPDGSIRQDQRDREGPSFPVVP
jgi:hypothetical protein